MSAALNVVQSNSRVSDEVRNANSRAIQKRDQWRRHYAELARAIRNHKEHREIRSDFVLRALQRSAIEMMNQRLVIRQQLIYTAYDWV
jgi:prephenate dehydrogenase